ncbi:MAG: hypothetical protein KBG15_12020 [Kofleriaceae bacterium]|nr:hypothetical protein [Kofleriaceae bacterium]
MKQLATLSIIVGISISGLLVACGSDSSVTADAPITADAAPDANASTELPVPAQGFQLKSPFVTIGAGKEETWRYFTTFRGDPEVGVKRWQSRMTPGSHHLIMYFTSSALGPDGTVQKGSCNGGSGNIPVWTYSAQSADAEAVMPAGVGMTVKNNQAICIEMHYLNTTDADLNARVTVNGETYAAGTSYMKAAAYVTSNLSINIPAQSTGMAQGSCAVPADAKFFAMSTHVHKQGTLTQVHDGAAVVFEATDWEHPGSKPFDAPFYTFASGKLNYRCEYNNPTDRVIKTGSSAITDEMCMAVGYFFPANKAVLCLNDTVVQQ